MYVSGENWWENPSGKMSPLRSGIFKRLPIFISLILVPVVFLPRNAFSQFEEEFEEEEPVRVEEWVVTAGKIPQPLSKAPAAITIITAEDIRLSGATNLGDLLRRVPGLEVISSTPSDYAIGARGQNKPVENGVMTLVDGRSIYQDYFGFVLWNMNDFPLEQIQRIEVVRGPGSVLYGANAFHAVVNIITKTPADLEGGLLSLTAGPTETIGTAMHAGKTGRLSHIVSAGYTQHAKYGDRDDGWVLPGSDDVVLWYPRGRASLAYDLGDYGLIQLEGGACGGDFEVFLDAFGMFKSKGTFYNLKTEYVIPNFYTRVFWNKAHNTNYSVPEMIFEGMSILDIPVEIEEGWMLDIDLDSDIYDIEAQKVLKLPRRNVLTVGGGYRYIDLQDDIIGGEDHHVTQSLFSAYLQHEFRLSDFFQSYLGLRYDHHPLTKSSASPRVSLLFTPVKRHTFRISAGNSYRNPTLTESYVDFIVPFVLLDINFQSNPDLDPERLTSIELGYNTSQLEDRLLVNFNLFYNQVRDLIMINFPSLTDVWLTDFGFTYSNVLDEDVYGLEAEANYRPLSWLSAFINYSFTWVESSFPDKSTEDPDDMTTETARRTPRHKVNGGVSAELANGFSGTMILHFVDETYWPPNVDRELNVFPLGEVPAYAILNLRVGYKFWKKRAEASLSGFNLLGSHKEFPNYVEEVDTRITGNIRVNF